MSSRPAVRQERRLRVELVEAALSEVTERRIASYSRGEKSFIVVYSFSPRSRARIRLMICWSVSVKAVGSADPGSARASISRRCSAPPPPYGMRRATQCPRLARSASRLVPFSRALAMPR